MAVQNYRPYTPSRRFIIGEDFSEITKSRPEKSLTTFKKKSGGRNNRGELTVRHRGGGHKQLYRFIDFKREKTGMPAKVLGV